MSRKRYTPEQIISMLREAEVALAEGQSVGQACRTLGVSEQSYYRWRKEYGLRSVRCAPLGGPNYDMWIALDALGRGQNFQPRDRHRLGAPSQGLAEVERALHLMICSHL